MKNDVRIRLPVTKIFMLLFLLIAPVQGDRRYP